MHATTSPTLATNKPGAPRVVAAAVALSAAVLVGAVIGVNIRTTGTAQSGAAAGAAQGAFDADRSATLVAPLNVDPPEDAIKAALAAPLNVDPPEDAINAAKDRTFAGPADVVRNLMAQGTGSWVSNGRGGVEYKLDAIATPGAGTGTGTWVANGRGGVEFVPKASDGRGAEYQLDKNAPFDPMGYVTLNSVQPLDTSPYINYADLMRQRAAASTIQSIHSDGFYLQEAGKRRFGAMHHRTDRPVLVTGNDQARGISIR